MLTSYLKVFRLFQIRNSLKIRRLAFPVSITLQGQKKTELMDCYTEVHRVYEK